MRSLTKKRIFSATAQTAVAAAAEKAKAMGLAMCIAVMDESGDLKAFMRMDGAPRLSIEIAQNKAHTAVGFGIPTDQWYEFIKNDPPLLHGITHTPRLIIFGGGYPIMEGKAVIGGIGISGGHYKQDMEVAAAALKAIGASA
ncbi:MAG: heme-binding protein [Alphaproteobacteria bacterium]